MKTLLAWFNTQLLYNSISVTVIREDFSQSEIFNSALETWSQCFTLQFSFLFSIAVFSCAFVLLRALSSSGISPGPSAVSLIALSSQVFIVRAQNLNSLVCRQSVLYLLAAKSSVCTKRKSGFFKGMRCLYSPVVHLSGGHKK